MHYDSYLNGIFSNPIMISYTTGVIGVNKEMSPIDIRKLNAMYPCKSTNSSCGKHCEKLMQFLWSMCILRQVILTI